MQACRGARRAELVAFAEALVGCWVRDVQARVDKLRTRAGECDVGITSMEAQLERFRLEAAEAQRQLEVVEAEPAASHARRLHSSGVAAGSPCVRTDNALLPRLVDLVYLLASFVVFKSADSPELKWSWMPLLRGRILRERFALAGRTTGLLRPRLPRQSPLSATRRVCLLSYRAVGVGATDAPSCGRPFFGASP